MRARGDSRRVRRGGVAPHPRFEHYMFRTAAIFRTPVQSNVVWKDCVKLLEALGTEISEGNGSRVRFALKGVRAVFHRPHPQKEIDKGALVDLRNFLENAGIAPKKGGEKPYG